MTRRFLSSAFCFLLTALCLLPSAFGQSATATLSGTVADQNGAVIPGATVTIINVGTGARRQTTTSDNGSFTIPLLPPSTYKLRVEHTGFSPIEVNNVVLNVGDQKALTIQLKAGGVNAMVQINADAPLINESPSVGTVVDRQFVENLPLNGRSFNTLLQLTPGVVIAPTNLRNTASNGYVGQFSIAGQRTDANNFSVDGVSANFGVNSSNLGESGTGSGQAFSALGGTSSLVSVDALQEFRIETSSFAPEFGRSPGGQVILTTRPGTNEFHGGVFDFFRNDKLDANDWFANAGRQPRAPERHNDFGGFLGGPIAKNRTFFFFSYEGARLRLPQTTVIQVPSTSARNSASAALAPFLKAYPQPNGPVSANGSTAQFTGTYSNSGTLDATSIRIDHVFNNRFSIFGRYNNAPSEAASRVFSLTTVEAVKVNTQTLTVGTTMLLSNKLVNTLRGNYSTQSSGTIDSLDSFAGAVIPDGTNWFGSLAGADSFLQFSTPEIALYRAGPQSRAQTKQFNFVDDLAFTTGPHRFQIGGDYRVIFLDTHPRARTAQLRGTSVPAFLSTGTATLTTGTNTPSQVLAQALSLYFQDNWKVSPRLTLTYGLRWELSPAPSARGNTILASWINVNDPAAIAIAPSGTPVWSTTHGNFAPRIGAAYLLNRNGTLVLRGAWGIFYDLGVGSSGFLATGFPNSVSRSAGSVTVPISDITPFLPPPVSLQPPFAFPIQAFSPNLKLPRSYQWNVALEKSFGGHQAISATYLGQAGRDLLRSEGLFRPNASFTSAFQVTLNTARSNYNAFQVQYRRPLSSRLQAILNYTWSHSLDNASNDQVVGLSNTVISAASDYSSSDFDVRHSFSGAISYVVPSVGKSGPLSVLTKGWSLDTVVVARSGFPFNAQYFAQSQAVGQAFIRPDLVAGQPVWISDATAGGGKSLNPNAFSIPSIVRQGTEPRNHIPGFGLTQFDFSVGRKFSITERINLQFRADAFNLFNHPNFTNPLALLPSIAFLKSSSMLNRGLGGLSPIFQQGGSRSMQLSLKLSF